jgi:hypothetical protein
MNRFFYIILIFSILGLHLTDVLEIHMNKTMRAVTLIGGPLQFAQTACVYKCCHANKRSALGLPLLLLLLLTPPAVTAVFHQYLYPRLLTCCSGSQYGYR